MTSCGNSQPPGWPVSQQGRRCSRPPSSTKRGSSLPAATRTGTDGAHLSAAAEAMRRILIDRARKRHRQRHGAGVRRVNLESVELAATTDDPTLLRVNEALERLAQETPDKAELVKLRYFAGLTISEAAATLGISVATAKRHWAYSRAWLLCELSRD